MNIDFPVFHLTPDCDWPPNQITSELNSLRTIVNMEFYSKLSKQQKLFFDNFLWETLLKLTKHSTPAVRLSASSVHGYILLRLAPFFFNDLISTLCDYIRKTGDTSYLYLTSFCFLSKFLSSAALGKVLSEAPIINLFKNASSEHLPNLIQQLKHFPKKFLVQVAEQFIHLSVKNPNNRHLPKAAAVIISNSIDEFADIISPELPLQLISSLFPDCLPKMKPEISEELKKVAIETIKAEKSLPTNYEAACRILYMLIKSEQINLNEIRNEIDQEIVLKSPNLTALMMLPIDYQIIFNLYLNKDGIEFSEYVFEKNQINPLLTYFSRNRKFKNELIILLNKNLTPTSDSYSFALQILGDVSMELPKNALNDLLMKAFSINTTNWIHKLWTLDLIHKLKFSMLTQPVSDLAFEIIELSSISKTEKLAQTAKEVTLKIFNTCHIEVFKLFIDKYCRRIDVFDQNIFELRISFLSYVFRHTTSHWTISFIHIAVAITEATDIFEFSPIVMMDVFYIIGILAQNLKEDFVLLLSFTRKALDIIEPSYLEFCGQTLGKDRPHLFNSISQSMSKDDKNRSLTKIDQITSQLNRLDTDLTSNPGAWHTEILHSAEAAFSMMVKVPWSKLKMQKEDLSYLFNIAMKLSYLFPSSSNILLSELIEMGELTIDLIRKYISLSLTVSCGGEALLTFTRNLALCIEKKVSLNLQKNDMTSYIKSMKITLPLMTNLDYVYVISAKEVLLKIAHIKLPDDIALKIIEKSQRYLLTDSSEFCEENSDDNIIDPHVLYTMSEDETADYRELSRDHSQEIFREARKDQKISTKSNIQKETETENIGLLKYCQTLSPFLVHRQKIPPELLKPVLLRSFFNYSSVVINMKESKFLLQYCLDNTNPQCLAAMLRYLNKNKIEINLKPFITHPFFNSKSLLSAVVNYINIKKLPNDYVNLVMKNVDLPNYVLNASTPFARRLAIILLKIDPSYFLKHFTNIEKFKYSQIYNLCLYVSSVKFPAEDFFVFAVSLISNNIESRKKKNLTRRLLTVFVYSNLANKDIVQKAYTLLNCDIGPYSNIDYVRKLSEAQIIELFFEANIIRDTVDCSVITETLIHALTLSTPQGMSLMLHFTTPSLETINNLLNSSLPSLQSLPYRFYHETLLKSQNNDISNSSLISPQILSSLLDFDCTNHIASNINNQINNICLGTIVINFIISLLKSKININKPIEKDIFRFINTNFNFSDNSSYSYLLIQCYFYLLPKISKESIEFEQIKSNVSSLLNCDIIQPLVFDILVKISQKLKDTTFAQSIIGSYLKEHCSYTSFMIAEAVMNYNLKFMKKIDDVMNVLIFAKSFYTTFNEFVTISKRKNSLPHKQVIGLFSKRHEKAITLFNDLSKRSFSIFFALMGDENDQPPAELLAYIKGIKDDTLLGTGIPVEAKYNVF
ncbi:hypothetical protein TRFO_23755 [Tritrichomonas foetus]|uniref:Uncharacterized protein n=1 Tax=Tritrichomonas foetus TaxID=1144522 RepID=A0A1J4KAF1_9EUKA|nr:hypothetical protein TRFO_23755 [Tritrichomonas foetus]|eukprot:OHT07888.1 hypothetical protein TRFO_23755 [Tritrichomonas foetus]